MSSIREGFLSHVVSCYWPVRNK